MTDRPRIVVIGSLNMDIVVEAERPPQMGETVLGQQVHFVPGGKGANQAVALARLGAQVAMIGAVGNDVFGQEMLSALQVDGIGGEGVKVLDGVPTGVASILLAEGDNSIVVVPGANYQCLPSDIDRHKEMIASADLVLLQLEIPLETVGHAAEVAKRYGRTVVLNPAPAQPLPKKLLALVDYLTPNQSELELISGVKVKGEGLEQAMDSLFNQGVSHCITTLGVEGAAYKTRGSSLEKVASYKVPVVDTTGAGDAFNAGLAFALATKQDVLPAMSFASKVSALAVTKLGAQAGMPTIAEVNKYFASTEGEIK